MSIYKYVVPDRIDILKNGKIRFTQPSALNDPYEMKPYFEEIVEKEELKSQLKNIEDLLNVENLEKSVDIVSRRVPNVDREGALKMLIEVRDNLTQVGKLQLTQFLNSEIDTAQDINPMSRKLFYDSLDLQTGVLCLTAAAKNILMWSHYAQNHQGFVIEFDEKHEFFRNIEFPEAMAGSLRQVVYVSERPKYQTLVELDEISVFLTKSNDWAYEQEWRMILPLKDASSKIGEDIYLFDFPPTCITGIIFGSNMQSDKKQEILDLTSTNPLYSHVAIRQASISETDFEIVIT